ncbi:G-protein coupled receptor Mth2-like isoform X12 [Onthophagus taurus]|uniref:G-protein coupled receptor Mth2-like isoform X12 n=1 Tax=Onthophagus taurus TaxID=166361 RepID=UPI000C1FEBE9|nr:G-protein coupled receptor Mth2-like isoform X12 [Onthophagus taurus]
MKLLAFLLFLLSITWLANANGPCEFELSVNLNNSVYDQIAKAYKLDSVVYTKDNVFTDEYGVLRGCPCNFRPCIRKCCGNSQELNKNKTCVESETEKNLIGDLVRDFGLDSKIHYVLVHNFSLCKQTRKFSLTKSDNFSITETGKLKWSKEFSQLTYCLDYFIPKILNQPIAVVCNEDQEKQVYYGGMIISMPFLIATFLVYALLPDKNLPAKSLMCYVLSLLFAYIMLVTIQLNSNLEHGACVTIAYLCYFFFMVSFFWMNSSCIDIWLTFSGIKGITGQRTQERKRFIYYCLYSWGLPLIMTSIVVVMTMEHLKDSIFFTAIGDGQCWFKNGLSTGIYFYFPIAILLITNIVLFAITALKIRNVQRDTKVLNAKDSSKHEKDKQRIDEYNSEPCYLIEPVKNRGMQVYDFLDVDNSCLGFNLYIKLLFAMGVNWSMEVISWLVQWQSNNVPTYIWYITDFCNAMYGVLIFFIFVFKKNIWIMLKKRYLQIMGRSTRAHSMGTSTHRTTLFTAISLQSIPGAGLLTKMHSTPNDNRNELRPPKIH